MEKRTTIECLELMHKDTHELIMHSLTKYSSKGVLVYENVALDSAGLGDKFAIGYGSQNTIKEVPTDGSCLVQPPNGGMAWKYKVVAYSDDLQ